MKSKEEIYESMLDIVPYHLIPPVKPYVLEAMEVYAAQELRALQHRHDYLDKKVTALCGTIESLQLSHDAIVHKLMAIGEVCDRYMGEVVDEINAIINPVKEGGV